MNKGQLLARRDYFNLVHGVTLRAIGALADDELDFRPRPGMRTPGNSDSESRYWRKLGRPARER